MWGLREIIVSYNRKAVVLYIKRDRIKGVGSKNGGTLVGVCLPSVNVSNSNRYLSEDSFVFL